MKYISLIITNYCCRFKNKPNLTFDDVTMEPDQVFELHRDSQGNLEYSPK